MRVFLDANILFSASREGSAIAELLATLRAADHALVASDYVLTEARRNLEIKAEASRLDALAQLVEEIEFVGTPPASRKVPDDIAEKDRPVFAAALAARCDVFLTGDRRHFGRHFGRTLSGVAIHSPATLHESLTPD